MLSRWKYDNSPHVMLRNTKNSDTINKVTESEFDYIMNQLKAVKVALY
jgi:hypothetical protein